jgi:asparagine synthase (glutamine-hydrolysing)
MRGILPAEFLARRKRGFRAPSGQWLREKLPEFALVLLSEDALRQKGYFKPDAVLQLLERHRTGGRSYAHQLLVVLAIQLWDDLFLRGCALHDGAVAGV